jgi:hypothetical protein
LSVQEETLEVTLRLSLLWWSRLFLLKGEMADSWVPVGMFIEAVCRGFIWSSDTKSSLSLIF